MLRINVSTSANQIKSYFRSGFSRDDYYARDELVVGTWHGLGAEKLALHGEVAEKDFHALVDNVNPSTGEKLTKRNKVNRRVGYDFTFSVPKSVSLVYSMTGDERILAGFRESVRETMVELEHESEVRVRKDGANKNRVSGNMVWAEYVHSTSRPVAGVSDMHLHSHCVVFNTSFDDVEGVWKAGDFARIKQQAPYYETAFESRMAVRLERLGYPVEARGKGWEIKGIERGVIDKFSRRTKEIDAKAIDLGIETEGLKATLGARTRAGKVDMSRAELRDHWQARLTPSEVKMIDNLRASADSEGLRKANEQDIQRALDYAAAHSFERASVLTEKEFLTEAMQAVRGQVSPEELRTALSQRKDLRFLERDGQPLITSRAAVREEKQMIDFVVKGKGRYRTLGPSRQGQRRYHAKRDYTYLTREQKEAVQHVWGSRDRVTAIRGGAGVGKTTLMKEAVGGLEARGRKVFTFAPTAEASRGALREAGFENAETLQKLLADEKLQKQVKGGVIWVDEAGLISNKNMQTLFGVAKKRNARIVLSGDSKQHHSVQRGDAFRVLQSEAGMSVAEVDQIQRQKGIYRDAVEHLSKGEVEQTKQGFQILDDMGAIHEEKDASKRRDMLLSHYQKAQEAQESVIVVSPTHREGSSLVEDLRASQRQRGVITGKDRIFYTQRDLNLTEAQKADPASYEAGQIVQFNYHGSGFRAGSRAKVLGRKGLDVQVENSKGEKRVLPLQDNYKFQVFRPEKMPLAKGDKLRITKGGQAKSSQGRSVRLENGQIHDVAGFTSEGDIKLANGHVVSKHYGNMRQGYVTTSHSAQSKTVDRVLVLQSSASDRVASREQFYVSVSRGRKGVNIFTDDKAALKESVSVSDQRLSATEALREDKKAKDRTRERAELEARLRKDQQITSQRERARTKQREKQKTPARKIEQELEWEM